MNEQSSSTKEIAGNIAEASKRIQQVSENISASSDVSGKISKDISEMDHSTSENT